MYKKKKSNVIRIRGFSESGTISPSLRHRRDRTPGGILRSTYYDYSNDSTDDYFRDVGSSAIPFPAAMDKVLKNSKGCLNFDRASNDTTNYNPNIDGNPEILYRDGIFGFFFLHVILFMFSIILRDKSIRKKKSYRDFVYVSKQFLYTPMTDEINSDEIHDNERGKMNPHSQVILDYLKGIIIPRVKGIIKFFIRILSLRRVSRICAFFTPMLFGWLIGPTKPLKIEMPRLDNQNEGKRKNMEIEKDQKEIWPSGVQITQCRYLHESACKVACVKLCKLPTQEFFTEELSIPLTMVPDFKDSSCQMLFGKPPPKFNEEDPVIQQLLESKSPCFLLEQLVKDAKVN